MDNECEAQDRYYCALLKDSEMKDNVGVVNPSDRAEGDLQNHTAVLFHFLYTKYIHKLM